MGYVRLAPRAQKPGRELCTGPPAKPHAVLVRDYFAAPVPTILRLLQTESIATGDLQPSTRILDSFWLILSGALQESFLRLAHIVKRERPRFNEVGHDGAAPASEQA